MDEGLVVHALDVLFLVPPEPSHDVEDLVLIDVHPQLHPFSDVNDAALLDGRVQLLAVLRDVLLDELLQLFPVHLEFPLEQADLKEGLQFSL